MSKRIVVLGAGESGAGAAVLAKKEGFDVFVSDLLLSNPSIRKCWIPMRFAGKKDNIRNLTS